MSLPSGKYYAIILRAKRIKGRHLMTVDLVLPETGERETCIMFMDDVPHVLVGAGMKFCDSSPLEYLQEHEEAPIMLVTLTYNKDYTSSRITRSRPTGKTAPCDIKMFQAARDFVEF